MHCRFSTRFRKLSSSKSFRMSPVAMQHTVELTTSYLGWSAMASGLPLEFSIAPNERIPWKNYFSTAQILLWRVLMATCDCVNGCLVVLPTIFFTVRLYARQSFIEGGAFSPFNQFAFAPPDLRAV